MSTPNRAEWEDMWKICKRMEKIIEEDTRFITKRKLYKEVDKLKKYIEDTIGQME